MNSATLSYQLQQFSGILRHSKRRETLVRDSDEWLVNAKQGVDAQVRSGDYFVTLATVLDQLGRELDYATRSRMEDLVSDLIYLQDNYEISKNNSQE
jgi:hypothetical protein